MALDPSVSNAHGQLGALVFTIKGILDALPRLRPFVDARLEALTADALGSKAEEDFISGINTVRTALMSRTQESDAGTQRESVNGRDEN